MGAILGCVHPSSSEFGFFILPWRSHGHIDCHACNRGHGTKHFYHGLRTWHVETDGTPSRRCMDAVVHTCFMVTL